MLSNCRLRTAIALTALALGIAACGDDDSDEPAPPPPTPPTETRHRVPDLPGGWKVHSNRAGGFALGAPPGWKAKDQGMSTSVRSFDHLVAVSISPDRSPEALEIPLEEFATRALSALPGFEGELDPGPPRRFRGRYEGVEVRAAGTAAETGVREHVRLVVLRRDAIVTFTVVLAASTRPSARASNRLAERMLRTLRSRPVGAPSPGRGSQSD
jgi:hypothetical protein